jgi:thioredoxin-like negative regulator of GroEL
LFASGTVKWGLDEPNETVFGLYGVPYQPKTVLIGSDGAIVDEWLGVRDESALRESLDNLIQRDG